MWTKFGDTTVCYCEVIVYFINKNSPLGLVSQTPAHWDQCILYRAEESLFWGKHACSLFTTSARIKRGVICVATNVCSWVIDPEMSNLWISCQIYRTVLCPVEVRVTVISASSVKDDPGLVTEADREDWGKSLFRMFCMPCHTSPCVQRSVMPRAA